jgi:hypothetical protein
MVFFSIVLIVIAIGCFFGARSQVGQLRAMSAADTFTAQMLQELYQRVVPSLGGEALAQACEVAGTIEAGRVTAAGVERARYDLEEGRHRPAPEASDRPLRFRARRSST